MSNFDVTVDTSPMAMTLDMVGLHVQDVNTSVLAMESAVILAEEEAAAKICRNVDAGFYILIKNQFSQKISAISAEMLGKMNHIESLKNSILRILAVMQDDYNRIEQRYTRHFNELDKALETRIHELDKKAYEIGKAYKTIQAKKCNDVIKTICFGDDNEMLNVKQVNATIKSRSLKSIATMTDDIIGQYDYLSSISNIISNRQSDREEEYIPCIISEMDSMMAKGSTIREVHSFSDGYAKDPRITASLQDSADTLNWKEADGKELESVKDCFKRKVDKEVDSERVAKEMMRLIEGSKWLVMEGER